MTDDEFIDPLHDPRFPDRPQSPDFWRLSEVILANDAQGKEQGFEAVVAPYVDADALTYMALQRTALAAVHGAGATASFIDGFMAGVRFAAAGGHRD